MKFTAPQFTHRARRACVALLVTMLAATLLADRAAGPALAQSAATDAADGFPLHLRDTGLFADAAGTQLRPGVMTYTPQYPLWSDGAAKQRWIYLPPGTQIDARDPDAWMFPVGTKLWKSFAHDCTVETRFMERRADGEWHFAVYVWKPDGSDATLAPARGVRDLPVDGAPGGRYDIPSRADCTACHEGAAVPVLGFSALQLSTSPDAGYRAPADGSALDLARLIARGLIRNQPADWQQTPPVLAATSSNERAALGYLHGNCGHCHNHNGSPAPVALVLGHSVADAGASRERFLHSAIEASARFRATAGTAPHIISPSRPDQSVLVQRMRSRLAADQMPPLGTRTVDREGLALIESWILQLKPTKEQTP